MLRIVALLAFSAAAFAQTPTVTAVVDGTNYLPQLCPGMVATVYGSNFGTDSANVSVAVGGKPGYVYPNTPIPTQFLVELPFEVPPTVTTGFVGVSYRTLPSAGGTTPGAPGLPIGMPAG